MMVDRSEEFLEEYTEDFKQWEKPVDLSVQIEFWNRTGLWRVGHEDGKGFAPLDVWINIYKDSNQTIKREKK